MIKLTRSRVYLEAKQYFDPTKISQRSLSTSNGRIYSSSFTDPYINLGIEDWLIKNKSLDHALLTYQNSPSVVIGRSQNPWSECNLQALQEENIHLVRRKSGGGTVYHDLGNSNYFVLMPRSTFKRTTNANMVKDALVDLGIPAEVTERKDIAVEGMKVSGSAYKLSGNNAYHHGTMLLNADLSRLSKVLKPLEVEITTKGVDSVRSPVTNLIKYCSGITHSLFAKSVVKRFCLTYGYPLAEPVIIDDAFVESNPAIIESANEIKSWDWTFGQTPEFSVKDVVTLGLFEDSIKDTYTLVFTCKYGRFKDITLYALTNNAGVSEAHSGAYTAALSQALTNHLKEHKLQKVSLQACLLLGPPELPAFDPMPEAAWLTLINRLIALSSF